jgi:hypothetical protein
MEDLSDSDYQLLAALLSHELPRTEQARALHLLDEHPTARLLHKRLARKYREEVPVAVDAAWQRLEHRIKLSSPE